MAGLLNPLGAPGPEGLRCDSCVWRAGGRCARHRAPVRGAWPACASHTQELDCLACGACCREAYHAVEVSRRDPYVRLHPDAVTRDGARLNVPRTAANWCVHLGETYRCAVYPDRPKTCRDFAKQGVNCAEARVRVGLTP